MCNKEERNEVEKIAVTVKEGPKFEETVVTQTLIDPPSRNEQLACKKLRQMDALDNNLVQSSVKEIVVSSKSKSSSSAAGMFYYFLNSSISWC